MLFPPNDQNPLNLSWADGWQARDMDGKLSERCRLTGYAVITDPRVIQTLRFPIVHLDRSMREEVRMFKAVTYFRDVNGVFRFLTVLTHKELAIYSPLVDDADAMTMHNLAHSPARLIMTAPDDLRRLPNDLEDAPYTVTQGHVYSQGRVYDQFFGPPHDQMHHDGRAVRDRDAAQRIYSPQIGFRGFRVLRRGGLRELLEN
jgi:hypothetical protein